MTGAVVLTAAEIEAIPTSAEEQPSGVATLDGSGVMPGAQLPSSVVSDSRNSTLLVNTAGFNPATDYGPTLQEHYDAGYTSVCFVGGGTVFLNSAIFLDRTSASEKFFLLGDGRTRLKLGSSLPKGFVI
jgi:hypothetical protein